MKTQRRHELQTSVLASSLARWIETAKPYSRAALAVVIALVVALFAWAYLSTQNTRRLADGWNEYFDAVNGRNPDPRALLLDISSRYSGTMVSEWARLTLANIQLESGTERLLQDRKLGRDELREASEKYQSLLLEASHETILQRSKYGLARAHEALGDLNRARTEYRELAAKWPKGPFAGVAKARADDLDKLATKNFYDWLARYEPPPPLSKEPGTPGARPDFLKEPDAGDMLKFPSSTPGAAGPALPSLSKEPAGEEPKGEIKPDSDKPAPAKTAEPTGDEPAKAAPNDSAAPAETGPKLK
jgi:hypothetical protein